jgi:uncharacterized membrane-anchored protein YjiN (DUF445 family)
MLDDIKFLAWQDYAGLNREEKVKPNNKRKMKATIEINDQTIELFIRDSIQQKLSTMNVDQIIEYKVNNRVSEIIKQKLSDAQIDNFARDRISRIITTESIKEFTFGMSNEDVLSNLEGKILLMIQHSKDFKFLVRNILKSSL